MRQSVLCLAFSALTACGTFSDPPGPAATTTSTAEGLVQTGSSTSSPTTLADVTPPTTGSGVPPSVAPGAGLLLRSDLTGAAVKPGPGDPDGRARVIISSDGHNGEVCYSLEVEALGAVQGLHIHLEPGTDDKVADLTNPPTASSRGCFDLGTGVLAAIGRSPGDYYVDVHTADHPLGAVGGKLGP